LKAPQESPSREGVDRLFDRIAPTYDRLNRLLSFRQDVAWRRKLVDAIPRDRDVRLLDIATGTADVLIMASKRCERLVRPVGVDFSEQMMDRGRTKLARLGLADTIELRRGDATGLDFQSDMFDAVTIAFGIRNVKNTDLALAEMLRVLRPGGRALILEFSLPRSPLVRGPYLFFFRHILPRVGGLVSGDGEAYRYLNETVETYPHGSAFLRMLEDVGFVDCTCTPLTFGVASLYTGQKPS